jgi:hypothetical protein
MKRQTNVCQNSRSGSIPSSVPQLAAAYNQICTVPKTLEVLANKSTEFHRLIIPVIVPISKTTAMFLCVNNNSYHPLVESKRAKGRAAQLPYSLRQYHISSPAPGLSSWSSDPAWSITHACSARVTGRIMVRYVALVANTVLAP